MKVFKLSIALFVLSFSHTLFAQSDSESAVTDSGPSCDWACPSQERNGKSLIIADSEFPPYTSPYSVFNCVYAHRGPTSASQPCRYYKKSGDFALGAATSACPVSATQSCASSDTEPERALVAPAIPHAQTTEVMPWVERSSISLWYLSHPIHRRDLSRRSVYSMMSA